MPVKFTAYTSRVMYELSGINLYDEKSLTQIFKSYEEGQVPTPDDMKVIAQFTYAALCGGAMPKDADETWKPSFSVQWVENNIDFKDGKIFKQIIAAYLNLNPDEIGKDEQEEDKKKVTADV